MGLAMAKAIKLSDELVNDAMINGKAQERSAPKQIEYWAKIGKIAIENPDLPYSFIQGVLLGIEEMDAGEVSEYTFG
jgi:hypothetical protein|tara:strand:- start:22756 stop:22986 length:231 start_codon:yes stop_codon:yes gene_type:complete